MKQLKLEVGKTYRSREGKEVKIIGKNGEGKYPYKGNNGEWYVEGGGFSYSTETPYDLIEEAPSVTSYTLGVLGGMKEATRHALTIPDGVKEITLSYEGNRIVVEMVPEGPKPGDVMVSTHGAVYIFKEVTNDDTHMSFACLGKSGRFYIGWEGYPGRPATPEEAQPLFDALKKEGKRWNPETMQVEDVPESNRIREWVEMNIKEHYLNQKDVAEAIEAYLKHKEAKK